MWCQYSLRTSFVVVSSGQPGKLYTTRPGSLPDVWVESQANQSTKQICVALVRERIRFHDIECAHAPRTARDSKRSGPHDHGPSVPMLSECTDADHPPMSGRFLLPLDA